MTEAIRAGRILTMDPGCPEIVDGGLCVRDGRILAVGHWKEVAGCGAQRDLGTATIVPGLINAHTHLELSHLAGRVSLGQGFMAWADSLFAAMRTERPGKTAMDLAARQARDSGTCCVADVVGRECELVRLVLQQLGLEGFLLREYSGRSRDFDPSDLPGLWSPGVHALYSTDFGFSQAVKGWCESRNLPFSLHLAEVPGENELFLRGEGEFADFLRQRRILPKGFRAPGLSAVQFAAEIGLLNERTLAVHCVQVDGDDIKILAQSGAFVCLCPRSNAGIGVGDAPAAVLYEAGIPLCLGTDSLASVQSLDLWDEVRALRRLLPAVTAFKDILPLVTANPARVLGLSQDYGSLAVGKRAVWAVLPRDLEDWSLDAGR
jgi:cytosine/adenosine deaminase-related metal-dependent hydrolase